MIFSPLILLVKLTDTWSDSFVVIMCAIFSINRGTNFSIPTSGTVIWQSTKTLHVSSSDDDCASWIAAATCGLKTNSEDNHVSLEEEQGIFSMDEGRDTHYSLSHPKIGNTRVSPFPQVHVQRSSPSLRSINNNANRQEEEEEEDVNALQNRFQELFYSNEENNLYNAKSVKKLKKVDIKDSLKLSENMEKTLECLESSLHDSEGGESLYQEIMNVERRLALKTSSYSFPPEVPSKDIIEEMLKRDRATQRYVSSCAVTSGSRRELFTNDDNGNDDDTNRPSNVMLTTMKVW